MYLAVVTLAILVHLIINYEVIFRSERYAKMYAIKQHRAFLVSVLVFYISDLAYAIAALVKVEGGVFITSSIFYIAMAVTVVLWGRYVLTYLKTSVKFAWVIIILGLALVATSIVFTIVNIFNNFMFVVQDEIFSAKPGVSIFLGIQTVMYIGTFLYAFIMFFKAKKENKFRKLSIAAFAFTMAATLVVQLYFPLQPVYTCGFLLSTCLLHTFVFIEEKKDLTQMIDKANENIENKEKELGSMTSLAYKDSLTGVQSKHAYVEEEDKFDVLIREKKIDRFAVVVFDLNDLKLINDTYGHEVGDKYIITSVGVIKRFFENMPIFRYGGDEFIVILLDKDYEKRKELSEAFKAQMKKNIGTRNPVIASGLSEFVAEKDNTFRSVFNRADLDMYVYKAELKNGK